VEFAPQLIFILHCLRSLTSCAIEEEEEDIYLAQTVTYKYTSDKLKNTFHEPGCQKTLRSTMLATNTYNFFLRATAGTAIARLSHRNSVRPSVRPSVCHTGGSGKNGAR